MRRMRHLKPREIQGCKLALDASIPSSLYDATSGGGLVAANGDVARWEDQSGNGYHVTQSTAGMRAVRKVGVRAGLDALQFPGGANRMINSSISVSLPFTLFSFGQTSETASVSIDSYDSIQSPIYRGGGADNPGLFVYGNNGAVTITDDSEWGGLLAIATSANGKSIRRGRATATTATSATNSLSGVSVGDIRGNPSVVVGGYNWGGYLSEIAVFSVALNNHVSQRLNDSRSRKWRADR